MLLPCDYGLRRAPLARPVRTWRLMKAQVGGWMIISLHLQSLEVYVPVWNCLFCIA